MNEQEKDDDLPATERLAPVRRSPSPALSQKQLDERMRSVATRLAPVLRGALHSPRKQRQKPRRSDQ